MPDCVVAVIRNIWPEADGHYVGFIEAASDDSSSDDD